MPDMNQKLSTSSPKTTTHPESSTNNTSGHKGTQKKHKRNRNRNRGKKNAVSPVVKVNQAPVKEYVSQCCNTTAKKPRTGTSIGGHSEGSGKKGSTDTTQVRGLGGWRCGICDKPCKVTVRKFQEEVPVIA
jgi:hypothetical protein